MRNVKYNKNVMEIMKNNASISTSSALRTMGLMLFCLFTCLPSHAQSWVKKASQGVFTLKTFGADGQLIGSSNGFFVSDEGDAVSCYTPFKGASRAVVIDAQGKEWPVEYMMGANEMYDVAKFRVAAKKATSLTLSTTGAAVGTAVWLLPYAVKKAPVCRNGNVSSADVIQEKYTYYTLSLKSDEQWVGLPLLTDEGQVVGMLQPAADNKQADTSYAIDARFAAELRMTGLSLNSAAMRQTSIPLAVPDDLQDAILSAYMGASSMSTEVFSEYIERFIAKFPNVPEGYEYRARLAVSKGDYAAADATMQEALKVSEKKDDTHYQLAQMMLQKHLQHADAPYEPWSLEHALEHARAAYQLNGISVYRLQEAQILYADKRYAEACDVYLALTKSDLKPAEQYLSAAQCKLQLKDNEGALALLDSAVNQFSRPYVKTAAPFLLARAQVRSEAGQYRPAVADFNEYEQLMTASQLGAHFYYVREQAEMKGHLFQQALDDIRRAVEAAPTEMLYLTERAAVELRLGQTDDALKSAEAIIRQEPDASDGYLFLGLAQCVKGMKQEGLQNLQKAKELGDEQAQQFIEKYSK